MVRPEVRTGEGSGLGPGTQGAQRVIGVCEGLCVFHTGAGGRGAGEV